jgi:DNA-directed RNA polymerase specialized sigma24 family protein
VKKLAEDVVAEAFALSGARGADLLARLGDFGVWRGDLATMRGDSPRGPASDGTPEAARPMATFLDALVLARAIEGLQPLCRAALTAVYAEQKDSASLAADLDTDAAQAQRIVSNCEQRLLEIYDDPAGSTARHRR